MTPAEWERLALLEARAAKGRATDEELAELERLRGKQVNETLQAP